MKIVIDNNVFIDYLYPNPDFEIDALEIFSLAKEGTIQGFVSANSLTDIFYVLKKKYGAVKTKNKIKLLLQFITIIGLKPEECFNALENPMGDFEDALIDVCAESVNADYIVSRDEKFIREETSVEVITPQQLLEKI